MARMAAFDRAISVVIKGARDQVQQALADVVQSELDRVVREDRPSGYQQFIDGTRDKPISQIEPFGEAVFNFTYHVEIVAFALEVLRALSPVLSGDYKHSHGVYIDGIRVDDFRTVPAGSAIFIASTLPYARRLEIPTKWRHGAQRGQPRGWSVQQQVPQPADSIYQHAADTVRRRYGNVMLIQYIWADAEGTRVPAISIMDRGST